MSSTENTPSVITLLKELNTLQSAGNSIYPEGIFPSQRYHPFLPYRREDDNLFFTSSVVRILQGVSSKFSDAEKEVFNSIQSKALNAYSLFQNKDGLDTFNFWQTNPSRHFPNGLFMHRFKHFQIPDDVDDTALVYLTEEASKERTSWLRDKLKLHSNHAYKKAFNPLPHYKDLKCYSTFLGKKMYIEFDFCVLSNLMFLILTHFDEDELDEFDKGTLEFICSVIERDEHISKPFYSAPNYPNTELILYHAARLMGLLPESYRKRIDGKIKSDIGSVLSKTKGLSLVLLENAAIKLEVETTQRSFDSSILNDTEFYFFHAGMITAFENTIAQRLAPNSLFHLRYTSRALNGALLIENLMLKRGSIALEHQSA
jgi:hypothetical protein